MSLPVTKIVRISRTITITTSVSIEVPAHLENDGIKLALEDEANLFDVIDGDTNHYNSDSNNTDDAWEVSDVPNPSETHFAAMNEDLIAALRDDDLVF